jgi:putative transposase
VKYAFISDQRNQHTVTMLCRVLGASRSGYSDWCCRSCSPRAVADHVLLKHIEAVHERHRGHNGALKTWRVLNDEEIPCGKHQVARIRRQHDIAAKRRRRFVVTTKSKGDYSRAPNLLSREFHQASPNKVWVGDVTYVRIPVKLISDSGFS